MERGMNFRIRRGVVPLPSAMALGATRSEEDARFTGQVTAREGRALGVHWAFAPVADVNSNPANPIINVRSYGEDPELVGKMTAAFVAGAHEGGLMATVKHYPGHGDTASDSHLQLATISGDRARLDRVELRPFRDAIAAGVDAVMLGHIAALALDPSGTPATLSEPIAGELRRGLGFRASWSRTPWRCRACARPGRARPRYAPCARARTSSSFPPDPDVAIRPSCARCGRDACPCAHRRVRDAHPGGEGAARARPQAPRRSLRDGGGDRPEDVARALDVARRSITVSATRGAACPSTPSSRCASSISCSPATRATTRIVGLPEAELAARKIPTQTFVLGPEVSPDTRRGSWPRRPASRT
jgi:beta-N-acetylhexosaminidase